VHAFLTALAIAVGLYALFIIGLVLLGRRTAAKELAVLLPNLIVLFKGLVTDARVSRGSKALLGLGALWLASPIDLIPEFIPLLGPLDDAVVAALILRKVVRSAGPEVIIDHWRGDPATIARIMRLAGASTAAREIPEADAG
jgi:uncharacterized membrane protein YkvA (DUF1232 family)